jgi:hypothetical protein
MEEVDAPISTKKQSKKLSKQHHSSTTSKLKHAGNSSRPIRPSFVKAQVLGDVG